MNELQELADEYIVAGVVYDSKLSEDLNVNQAHLNDEYVTHAERFAWYSTAHDLALDYELRTKAELDRLYAQLDYTVRTEALNAGVKMTEKKVENSVITRPEYVKKQEELFDAKRNAALLKSAMYAMIHKKEMLISLGANYRAEGASDISLKIEQYKQASQ